jgi:hypothetical protein
MTLLLPFIPVFSAYFFWYLKNKLKSKLWIYKILIAFTLLFLTIYALGFSNIYFHPVTRIAASDWIYDNIPKNSKIATEHWDDSLPVGRPNKQNTYNMTNLYVYDQDNPEKIQRLLQTVSSSDYIIFSSRRVFYSILRNPELYPFTSQFYKKLFEGKLGYTLEKTFTQYPKLLGIIEINDDIGDETIQSYDHPPVYIFKNIDYSDPLMLEKKILTY